jgi:PKD repeat protein
MFLILPLYFYSQNKKEGNHSPQNLPPDVHFSWINACAGDTTCFINQTQMGNTYTWTVVGGPGHPHTLYTTSNTNMCYFFSTPGTYSVSLHAFNNHDVILTKIITIDTVTKANFDFVRCANIFPNNSLCATSFKWNFGDGNTSTQFTPVHQYADTGHYNVTLISYNGTKSDTIKKIIYIDAISYVDPTFTYTVSFNTVFVHANFNGGSTNYYWNFNDPLNPLTSNSTGRDTIHVFRDSTAQYIVSLTVVNQCGPRFYSDTVQINSSKIPLQLPSGLTFTSNLAIVPNPVENNELNVFYDSFTDSDFLVNVYNPLGQIVFEEYYTFLSGINGFKVSTIGFAKGLYIITIFSDKTYARRKFVVQH